MNQRDRAIYWHFVCLDLQRGCKHLEVTAARDYLVANLPDDDRSDAAIARQLYQTWQTEPASAEPSGAELGLRCYISHQIAYTCRQFAEQFGKTRGFGARELLPLVLTDVSLAKSLRAPAAAQTDSDYQPLAAEILRTFEPSRGSLSAWTSRLVRQQREFNAFLRDRGVYLISDWALLNDTAPHRLPRCLQLPAAEVERYQALLTSYHAVYRRDRLLAGQNGRCLPPTPAQLQRIAQHLQQHAGWQDSNSNLFHHLRQLASWLREYRLQQRSNSLLADSLDDPNLHETATAPLASDDERLQQDFLQRYHQLIATCLEQAVERALRDRLQRRPERAASLLEGLYRFHVLGETMTAIAPQVGCKAQYQVSRLLNLKQLRDRSSQYALELLVEQVASLAGAYTDGDRLQELYTAIQDTLAAELEEIIAEAASEAEVKQRQQPPRSLFARSLCHCLERLGAEREGRVNLEACG